MARIRTIKPEFFADEDLAKCSPYARLLAIALLQIADSEGRMRWIPTQVNAHAFPWETIDLSPLLHELCTIDYLRIYTVESREYAEIPGFKRHQRLTGKEAQQESKFPSSDQADTEGKQKGNTQCFPGKHLDAQEQGTGNKGTGGVGDTVSWMLPEHVNAKTWGEFEAHRKAIKKPLTNQAREKNANILAAYPPDVQQQIVDTTIANRWTGLFPPKGPQPTAQKGPPETVRPSARELP